MSYCCFWRVGVVLSTWRPCCGCPVTKRRSLEMYALMLWPSIPCFLVVNEECEMFWGSDCGTLRVMVLESWSWRELWGCASDGGTVGMWGRSLLVRKESCLINCFGSLGSLKIRGLKRELLGTWPLFLGTCYKAPPRKRPLYSPPWAVSLSKPVSFQRYCGGADNSSSQLFT